MRTGTNTSTRRRPGRPAPDDLRGRFRDLHEFAVALRDATGEYRRLRARGAFAEGRDVDFRRDDKNHPLNRSVDITERGEFLVAVTGAFSSGKSTVLNQLLGHDDLLPASAIPMTAVCTVIRHGAEPSCTVRYAGFEECFARAVATIDAPFRRRFAGREDLAAAATDPGQFVDGDEARATLRRFAHVLERHDRIAALRPSFEERMPFIAGGGVVRDEHGGALRYHPPTPGGEAAYRAAGGDPERWVTREWLALIRDVELRVDDPLLEQRAVFLDLPGLNCKEDYHRRAIREFCNMADCVVVTAFQPGNQADAEAIANFRRLTSAYRDKTFFVFNKVDQFADEPGELVHAVDYLSHDTIGADFAEDRFFLTSAALGRSHRQGDPAARTRARDLGARLEPAVAQMPALARWVRPLVDANDPGGIGHLRASIRGFLADEAFPGKIEEVLRHLDDGLAALVDAATPAYQRHRDLDPADLQRQAVLEAGRAVRDRLLLGVRALRHGYLQGEPGGAEGGGGGALRGDLHRILDRVHGEVQRRIAGHFDRPILQAPLREDPVPEFDFLLIADRAADELRQEVQRLLVDAVDTHVRRVVRERVLAKGRVRDDLAGLLAGVPEQLQRFDAAIERFEATLRHSIQGIVRHGFFRMPRGRDLRRLERRVPAQRLKEQLVGVFRDFYPGWIHEAIYTRLVDELWVHLFLDSEEFEGELGNWFATLEGALAGQQAVARARLPFDAATAGPAHGRSELAAAVELCRRIEALERDAERLRRGESTGRSGAAVGAEGAEEVA